jgi:hypothetical protein
VKLAEVSIKPTQTLDIVVKRRFVLMLIYPSDHGILPCAAGLLSQMVHPP